MRISNNFSLRELTKSNTAQRNGINNTPGVIELINLTRLTVLVLQPLREELGRPLHITSGFRCRELNSILPGASKTSAHLSGRAADCVVDGMTNGELIQMIHSLNLPVDQVINEFASSASGGWTHIAVAAPGAVPRGEILLATGDKNNPTYTKV